MAPTTRKRNSNYNDDDSPNVGSDSDYHRAPAKKKPRTPAPRSRQAAKSSGRHQQEEADLTFTDWKTWQSNFRTGESEKIKQYLARLQDDFEKAQREIIEELQKAESDLINKAADTMDRVLQVYSASEPSEGIRPTEGKKNHPLRETGQKILDACRGILDRHEKANSLSSSQAPSCPDEKWRQDEKDTRELIRYGRQYGEGIAQCIIVPRDGPPREILEAGEDDELTDTGKLAIGLFEKSRKYVENEETWAQAAQSQVRALSGLAKTMPE